MGPLAVADHVRPGRDRHGVGDELREETPVPVRQRRKRVELAQQGMVVEHRTEPHGTYVPWGSNAFGAFGIGA
ncbi:hypothetical protein Maq22A_c23535 [Methylobacterium aquaticum]|uniref:Uncharacterized protein n=1 Tax=Methylobacterium aquaticum TaxID=270351 RepID=A0A0C6F4L2_9HYPH|nr:hypothetical protein Maq22A_c23535 [Methylobacterium aquaticum]